MRPPSPAEMADAYYGPMPRPERDIFINGIEVERVRVALALEQAMSEGVRPYWLVHFVAALRGTP